MARPREDRIGRYELLIELGQGGMAELFLGRLHGAGGFAKLVAIKRILPHLARDEQFTAMFLDEGRIASQLSHPNVCQVFELDDSDGDLYLAMEYLDGVSWDQLLIASKVDGSPSLALAAGVLAQAADGLHYAHTLRDVEGRPTPVVHRDVSPQNLFVTVDGICKVLDFGVSKMMTDGPRTKSGVVKGKLPYMAPEQIRGEPVDARTDVFSLGVCLWEALAGERLYDRATDFLIWKAVTEEDAPLITTRWPGCPVAIEGLVRRALSRDPAERIASARAFAEELRAAVPQLSAPSAIADQLRLACADRLSTRAKQVATAISTRRALPGEPHRPTPTPYERPRAPTPDPSASAAETLHHGRSSAMTLDDGPISADPAVTTDLRSRAIRLRDKSHVVERSSDRAIDRTSDDPSEKVTVRGSGSARWRVALADPDESPGDWSVADPTRDHLEAAAQKHNRVGLIVGAIAAIVVIVVVIVIATRSSSGPSTPPKLVAPDAALAVDAAALAADAAAPIAVDASPAVVVDAAPAIVADAAQAADAPPAPKPVKKPEPRQNPTAPDIDFLPTKPAPPPTPTTGEPGSLSIASEPYATIYVDGKKLGDTPLFRQSIPSGTHTIRAVRADGKEKTFTVEVVPGKEHNAGRLAW